MPIEAVVPATFLDCLTCAGGRAYARKGSIWMRSKGDTVALSLDGELLAVAYLVPDQAGRLEFCLSIRPEARPHMLALCRFAHSTLRSLTDHGAVVFCRVMPGNRSGERMARLCGFHPSTGIEWHIDGGGNAGGSRFVWRRKQQQGGIPGGREEPSAPAGGE
jgi:hypothetical protein